MSKKLKPHSVFVIFSIVCVITLSFLIPAYFIYQSSIQNVDIELNFDKNKAYNHVQNQLEFGNRIPGTDARVNCAKYFVSEAQEVDNQINAFYHNFSVNTVDCQNVLVKINTEKSNIIILGAHYDSRAKATHDPISANRIKPVPGANDGASGAAVLLELISVFNERKGSLDCQIWFLFFDAEDQGHDGVDYGLSDWNFCEGSDKFVDDIDNFYNVDEENFDCMILLDMVGGENLQFINEQYSTSSLLSELFEIGRQLGYTEEFPENPISQAVEDDHRAFLSIGIPAADLIIQFWNVPDAWPYWHTISDDINHISRSSLEVTGKTVEQFVYNNYYINSSNYEGNYPWETDQPFLDSQIIPFLIIIIAFAGIISISIHFIKKRRLREKIDLIHRGKEQI